MKRLLMVLLLWPSLLAAQTAPRCIASWNVVTTTVTGNPITGVTYNLYRGLMSSGSDLAKIAGPLSVLTYTDLTISGTVQYYYAVSAVTTGGIEGGKSAIAGFKFSDLVPGAPPNLTLALGPSQPGRSSVQAAWSPAVIVAGGQCMYQLYKNSVLATATSALSYLDANLKKNQTLMYAVSCLSIATGIEGPRSAPQTIQT